MNGMYEELIEKLRKNNRMSGWTHIDRLMDDAIKAIEALQQENERLNAALDKVVAFSYHKILPAKPGDIIYRPEALQFCWVITKVEIYEDEIVFIDDSDNIFRPDDIGKTVFLTREEADKAIGGKAHE